jgi:hypothetical protein
VVCVGRDPGHHAGKDVGLLLATNGPLPSGPTISATRSGGGAPRPTGAGAGGRAHVATASTAIAAVVHRHGAHIVMPNL